MKDINTLLNKYPKLFGEMAFGIECGDGWFDLIDKLCEDITKADPEVIALQVKEKFGTLRFYITAYSEIGDTGEVFDLIDEAEDASEKICEECGAPGKLEGKMWFKTICEKCKKEISEERLKVCPEAKFCLKCNK